MQPIAGYNFWSKVVRPGEQGTETDNNLCHRSDHFRLSGRYAGTGPGGGHLYIRYAELTELSATGLRITVMFFPIIGFQMVTSNFFQSIGMAGKAIFLSLTRQMLILLPCLLILPHFFGVAGVV